MLKYSNPNQPGAPIQMRNLLSLTLVAIFFTASSQALACDYPARPHIPDGDTASKDELLAAKAGVTEFLSAVDDYLRCVEAEEKAAIDAMEDPDPEVIQARDEMLTKKFDAANDEKALVGEQFNQQVRIYNSKRKQAQ